MIHGVLLYQRCDVRALLNLQRYRMYLFTSLTWLLVFLMITESFSHSSIPALQFFFWMSFDVFSQRSTHPSKQIFCLVIGSATHVLVHLRKWSPINLIFWCAMALVSSDLFEVARVIEWFGSLSQLQFESSFPVRQSIRQASFRICRKTILNLFLLEQQLHWNWTSLSLFSMMISAVPEIVLTCLSSIHRFFCVGDNPSSLSCCLPNLSDPSLRLMVFWRISATQDTTVRCLMEFQRIFVLLPDLSQKIGHDGWL